MTTSTLFAVPALLLLNLASPAATYSNIEYSDPDGKPLLLDVYVPDGAGPFPAAIIVHGGSWTGGNKTRYINPLKPLLEKAGYAWFSIDYRLAPDFRFPADLDDVEDAVKWVRRHARQYHVDKDRLALIGESAGGHLVAMAGARSRIKVAAVVDFYGPNDLRPIQQLKSPPPGVRELFGITAWDDSSPALLASASPVAFVHKGMPPFLCIHGTADALVPFTMSPLMCDAMKKVEAPCQVVKVEGGVHGMENWEKNPAQQNWKPALIEWLNQTLKPKSTT